MTRQLRIITAVLLMALACAAQTPITLATSQAQAPSILTVAQTGITGTTQYCYWVVAVYTGGKSGPAGPLCTNGSNATLSSSNYNTVTFSAPTSPLAAVSSYDLLRTTTQTPPTGACACAVSTAQSGSPLNDQSNTLSAYTVATLASVNVSVVGDNVTTSGTTSARVQINGTTNLLLNSGGIGQPSTAFTAFGSPTPPIVALLTDLTDVSGKIFYTQVYIPNTITVTGLCVMAGTASTDSFTMGLYSMAGTLLANTALAGAAFTASTVNCQALTATKVVAGPASYLVALQGNGTTAASFWVYAAGGLPTGWITGAQTGGTFGTLGAITSPATSFTAAVGPVASVY